MQKFFAYFIWILLIVAILYLTLFLWWLILPFFVLLFALTAWRVYQARKMWQNLVNQTQKDNQKRKTYQKVSDDNVIDVEYEEIKN